ncbi:MAG TPA: PhoH family protein [Gemmatimonadota bacterium]|jgi:phosphate starvation-inducible PhoH-like protein
MPIAAVPAKRRLPLQGVDQLLLFGTNDRNLKRVESLTGTRIVARNETLLLEGPGEGVEAAARLLVHMMDRVQTGSMLEPGDLERLQADLASAPDLAERLDEGRIELRGIQKIIRPKTSGQAHYLRAILANDIVVGIGPAGTGKTYLAVAAAVDALNKRAVKRIILARPALEAGESLGFLPGDLQEKVDPYLRPLYDALEDMLPGERVQKFLENRIIEVAPLAYMRGRTLADAFVILDEAQNATVQQMKMFLTRLGLNSRTVITGDKTQIDLPAREESGLLHIERILTGIEGLAFVYLHDRDVVRHPLVQEIIKAYAAASDEDHARPRARRRR